MCSVRAKPFSSFQFFYRTPFHLFHSICFVFLLSLHTSVCFFFLRSFFCFFIRLFIFVFLCFFPLFFLSSSLCPQLIGVLSVVGYSAVVYDMNMYVCYSVCSSVFRVFVFFILCRVHFPFSYPSALCFSSLLRHLFPF